MKSNGHDSEQITYRDVTLYLLGQASESVRERINADVEKPDSQVLAFLGWLGDPSIDGPVIERVQARPRLISQLFGKTGLVAASAILAGLASILYFSAHNKNSVRNVNPVNNSENNIIVYKFNSSISQEERQKIRKGIEVLIANLSESGIDPSNLGRSSTQLITSFDQQDTDVLANNTYSFLDEADKLIKQIKTKAAGLEQVRPRTEEVEEKLGRLNIALAETKKVRDGVLYRKR